MFYYQFKLIYLHMMPYSKLKKSKIFRYSVFMANRAIGDGLFGKRFRTPKQTAMIIKLESQNESRTGQNNK